MKTATEMYVEIKSSPHYGCIVIPQKSLEENKLLCHVVKCIHGDREIVIERKDI